MPCGNLKLYHVSNLGPSLTIIMDNGNQYLKNIYVQKSL